MMRKQVIAVVIFSALASAQSSRQPVAKVDLKTTVKPRSLPTIAPLGSVLTSSAAQSFVVNGNLAYVCDANEISVVDVSNPASPHVVGTATASFISNSNSIHCDIQRNTLVVFTDQASTTSGQKSPGFVAFSLANPTQPSVIAQTTIDKRFFDQILYLGNLAFVSTFLVDDCFGSWDNQWGDLLAVDVTNFSTPKLLSTLEPQQPTACFFSPSEGGGFTMVWGIAQANGSLLYIGGSTSTGPQNNGSGRLQTVDVSNPLKMQVVQQLLIPGTRQFQVPQIQGTIGVGIGNNGGFTGAVTALGAPKQGNIVVATFDLSDPREPSILSTTTTPYLAGPTFSGATRIGNYQFAFSGVLDSNNNNVLLLVDATNPVAPVIQSMQIPNAATSLGVSGSTLYATLGPGGFATYSIPPVGTAGPSVCPVFVDAMLVIDRGANIPAQAFGSAQTALENFVSTLHLPSDHVGVVSFTTSGSLNQPLTSTAGPVDAAINGIVPGGLSYIGSGISAAQAELTGPDHNASATPIMIVLSDGVDAGAPTPNSTLAAANAAKAAGIQIISIQYGTGATTLMQSIASSANSFYQVPK